ncbi:MAG: hypothetical protein LLG37_02945, partial [Spirochaetia bacterium]|nr:hypothetical protein [Spirochaetia bacterium]
MKSGTTKDPRGIIIKIAMNVIIAACLFFHTAGLFAAAETAGHETVPAFVAYDPAAGSFILKIRETRAPKEFKERFKYRVVGKSRKPGDGILEMNIPAKEAEKTAEFIGQRLEAAEITAAKVSSRRIKDDVVRVELSNKMDGQWYLLSADIPAGYNVKRIYRDDGMALDNTTVFDDEGVAVQDVKWYRQGNKVYFYDDPVFGYSVVLSPPQPYMSIAVLEATGGAGQISSIVYPYAGEDMITTDAYDKLDHIGRIQDNNWGADTDIDCGTKIAFRYTSGDNTYQYGNPARVVAGTGRDRTFEHVASTEYQLRTTPWGETESVILTTFRTTRTNGTEIPILGTKKTIIRGNKKWFATIFYFRNNYTGGTPRNAINVRFFQGLDWNFNGTIADDSCSYDAVKDTVFGYKPAGVPISYGGFSGGKPSAAHQVSAYNAIWTNIRNAGLSNSTDFTGDAAIAMEWNLGAIMQGATGIAEIIYGYGNTLNGQAQTDMQNEIDYGMQRLRDTGVMEIKAPEAGTVYQNSRSYVMITGTVVDYGLRDWTGLTVHARITGPAGFTAIDTPFAWVNLSVPLAESAEVGYRFDISSVPQGEYTITLYTDLDNDNLIADQNRQNDSKSVTIIVGGVSLSPSVLQVTDAGMAGTIDLSLTNTAGADDYFDIDLTSSTKGWPTDLIRGDTGVVIASDTDGDGNWDTVTPGYDAENGNNKPEVRVANMAGFMMRLKKYVPDSAISGETDTTTVRATGISNALLTASVKEYTRVSSAGSVNKTLWLHGGIQAPAQNNYSLTTLTDTAAVQTYSIVGPLQTQSWSLSPVLYRELRITQDIAVNLYCS